MSETITLHALDLSGETTLKLFLRKDDGTLLNTGGDALTEISSSGVFTATLGEARTGLGTLSVRVCDGTETADNLLIDDFLPESSTVIGSKVNAELDSASVTAVQSGLALEATSQSIKTKTDNLPTDPADQSLIIAATDAVMNRLGAPAGASVSADVAAVKSDTASLLSRLTANAATAIQNLYHMITGTGASSKYTVAALENAPGSSGGLTSGQQEQLDTIEVAVTGGQIVQTTGFGIPDASGALLLKRGHTATVTFTSATSNIVTDLSGDGKKVFFGVRTVSGNLLISGVEGEVLVATGLQSVRFTLTASQALALVAGVHLYDVVCVYGYSASLDPPYTSMEPFTGGYVRVQEVGVDLAEL